MREKKMKEIVWFESMVLGYFPPPPNVNGSSQWILITPSQSVLQIPRVVATWRNISICRRGTHQEEQQKKNCKGFKKSAMQKD